MTGCGLTCLIMPKTRSTSGIPGRQGNCKMKNEEWKMRIAAAGLVVRILPVFVLVLVTHSAGAATEVAVVFNSRVPESKEVAEYYAQRRQVPKEQVFGLELPTTE